jgi:hypothetical protein
MSLCGFLSEGTDIQFAFTYCANILNHIKILCCEPKTATYPLLYLNSLLPLVINILLLLQFNVEFRDK